MTTSTIKAPAPAAATQPAPAPHDYFVLVPETTLPNSLVVPAFRVAQYLTSRGAEGKAVIDPTLAPWGSINYHEARAAAADAGMSLITESQALALAHRIANIADNWSGGAVGEGALKQGLHLGSVRSAQPGNFQPSNPREDRWFAFTDDLRVCDYAGNAYTWIFDDRQGNADGIVARAFAADSPSITTAPYPSMEKGMGWRPSAGTNWSGNALVRGGDWRDGGYAGVFALDYGFPDYRRDRVGFRCTLPA